MHPSRPLLPSTRKSVYLMIFWVINLLLLSKFRASKQVKLGEFHLEKLFHFQAVQTSKSRIHPSIWLISSGYSRFVNYNLPTIAKATRWNWIHSSGSFGLLSSCSWRKDCTKMTVLIALFDTVISDDGSSGFPALIYLPALGNSDFPLERFSQVMNKIVQEFRNITKSSSGSVLVRC